MTTAGGVLTSKAILFQGKRTPIYRFNKDDYIVQLVDMTWPEDLRDSGVHGVTWNWYHNGALVAQQGDKPGRPWPIRFNNSPFELQGEIAASDLGSGRFTVETLVDQHVVATSIFDVN